MSAAAAAGSRLVSFMKSLLRSPKRATHSTGRLPLHARHAAEFVTLLVSAVFLLTTAQAPAAEPMRVDAGRAFRYLKEVCDIGPRISGTDGMAQQRELLDAHFTKLGATVGYQEFDAVHPLTGAPVRLANMIVSWRPDATTRVLLGCHYDTRPWPDRDPIPANRTKPFIGANDGASGVALFMELGHHLPASNTKHGVDFVFFDAEELIYSDRDKYFLGSTWFATRYRDAPPEHRYACGVLVDMIGDRNLNIFQERNSVSYAPQVTRSVWDAAARLRVREFIPRLKHEVRDDHLPLNEIARIPTCDVIDFDYPHWHTRNDLPAACSGDSLAKVGRVLLEWLPNAPVGPNR